MVNVLGIVVEERGFHEQRQVESMEFKIIVSSKADLGQGICKILPTFY